MTSYSNNKNDDALLFDGLEKAENIFGAFRAITKQSLKLFANATTAQLQVPQLAHETQIGRKLKAGSHKVYWEVNMIVLDLGHIVNMIVYAPRSSRCSTEVGVR